MNYMLNESIMLQRAPDMQSESCYQEGLHVVGGTSPGPEVVGSMGIDGNEERAVEMAEMAWQWCRGKEDRGVTGTCLPRGKVWDVILET